MSFSTIVEDMDLLMEDPVTSAPPSSAAGAGQRCPNGQRKHPETGRCVPREQLKAAMRAHEPKAALHRDKAAHHANLSAQFRSQGDVTRAAKHAQRSQAHMVRAQQHHQSFTNYQNALYPHKAAQSGQSGQDHRVMSMPAVRNIPKSFGGSMWGPAADPSAQAHPPPAPQTAPAQAAPAQPKKPGMLGQFGQSLLHGLGQAAVSHGQKKGSVGWSALGHALQHYMARGSADASPAATQSAHQDSVPSHPAPAVASQPAHTSRPKTPSQRKPGPVQTGPKPTPAPAVHPKAPPAKPAAPKIHHPIATAQTQPQAVVHPQQGRPAEAPPLQSHPPQPLIRITPPPFKVPSQVAPAPAPVAQAQSPFGISKPKTPPFGQHSKALDAIGHAQTIEVPTFTDQTQQNPVHRAPTQAGPAPVRPKRLPTTRISYPTSA